MKESVTFLIDDPINPESAFDALKEKGCCLFEFDSKSFLGIHPIGTFRSIGRHIQIEMFGKTCSFEGDPYTELRRFSHGRKTFGFIAYDAVRIKEKIPNRHAKNTDVPDIFFRLFQTIISFDQNQITIFHEGTKVELDEIVHQCKNRKSSPPFQLSSTPISTDISSEEFEKLVLRAQEYIRQGDVFQVVLSRTFYADISAKPFDIYRSLKIRTHAPYHFYIEEDDFAIAGASPELFVSVQDGMIESMPIAGTCSNESQTDLLTDSKERAEHMMLIDLARNDIGQIAEIGSVKVSEMMKIKRFSHLQHIVSRVGGKLKPGLDAFDAIQATLPAGTLSGAPKIRAMEIIDELENRPRGLYGGAVVFIDEYRNCSSCIAIRTIMMKNGRAEIRAGAGIVYDSIPFKEAKETQIKATGAIVALGGVI